MANLFPRRTSTASSTTVAFISSPSASAMNTTLPAATTPTTPPAATMPTNPPAATPTPATPAATPAATPTAATPAVATPAATPVPLSLYKTRLCKNFYDYGTCLRGKDCNFAHGDPDLRIGKAPTNMRNYQKELCRDFRDGFCLRGSACWYKHKSQVTECPFYLGSGKCYGDCGFPHREKRLKSCHAD